MDRPALSNLFMKNKKIIFEITHPKHFHQFKNLIGLFAGENRIMILARNKEVVLNLVKSIDVEYYAYNDFGKNLITKSILIPKILFKYVKVISKFKPDFIISRSSPYSAFLSKLFNYESIIFPDSEVVTLTKRFVAPQSNLIITPNNYTIDYGKKHHRVSGFFEESYLSPRYFKPDTNIIQSGIKHPDEKFFFLRFVSWQANHDVNQFGFDLEQKRALVNYLSNFGNVLISSEQTIEKEFEKFRIRIPPENIHHILSQARMYVGDSQSMATEAALLGVPSIRYNSFVGDRDMSNFIKLEKELGLLYNFNDFDLLLKKIEELLSNPDLKQEWNKKREKYFKNAGDINQESLNIISSFISSL